MLLLPLLLCCCCHCHFAAATASSTGFTCSRRRISSGPDVGTSAGTIGGDHICVGGLPLSPLPTLFAASASSYAADITANCQFHILCHRFYLHCHPR